MHTGMHHFGEQLAIGVERCFFGLSRKIISVRTYAHASPVGFEHLNVLCDICTKPRRLHFYRFFLLPVLYINLFFFIL